jgi:hypothetical protein
MWDLFMVLLVVSIAWWLYMMTFRTNEYLKLLKADQERKAKRNERALGLAKGLAMWWLKK